MPGPGGVRREGVAVEVAGDVTGTPGVGVLPPRPTQRPRFLQDGEPQTQTLQFSAHTDARDPGPDNNNMEVRGGCGDLGWLRDLPVE